MSNPPEPENTEINLSEPIVRGEKEITTVRNQPKPENIEINLSEPIVRGEKEITTVRLRMPRAGELRGLKIMHLATGDVNEVMKLADRISEPPLYASDLNDLPACDIGDIAMEVGHLFTR